ncbi:CYTH domain-containing protein [bacterium]|nr:CYTH domain-containing protein [bacterium]
MKEIEVKILSIDPDLIESKLLKLGAKKEFSGLLKVRYFDKDNGEIREKGDLLRVRQVGDKKTEICYKTNKHTENGFKVCDEYNVTATDFSESVEFFKQLGFKITCSYEKKRTIFKYNDLEIVIDEYPKIPPFIEIEGSNIGLVEELILGLDLSENERSTHSIGGLLKEKYPDIELDGLTF